MPVEHRSFYRSEVWAQSSGFSAQGLTELKSRYIHILIWSLKSFSKLILVLTEVSSFQQ